MSVAASRHKTVFKVLDAMDAPHRGRHLRLRLQSGETPTVRELRGARMRAESPDGERTADFTIENFAAFGGRPSDDRLARTGRVDVHVTQDEGTDPIGLTWRVFGPIG